MGKLIVGENDLYTWCLNNGEWGARLIEEWDQEKNKILMSEISYGNQDKNKKIWWRCSKCGNSWGTTAGYRTNVRPGCPVCSRIKILSGYNDLGTKHPELIAHYDSEKNKKSIYEIGVGGHTAVYWVCQYGHSFTNTAHNILKGEWCPECSKKHGTSFPETAIYYYFNNQFEGVEHRKIIFGKEADVYISAIKTAIEYDGEKFHSGEYKVIKDKEKDKVFFENGVRLFRVRENKCPEYDSTSEKICVKYGDYKCLDNAITSILHLVGVDSVDINSERDRFEILHLMGQEKRERSLAVKATEVAELFDIEKNYPLTPLDISYGSKAKVYWRCKNGHSYQGSVSNIVKKFKNGCGCGYCANRKIIKNENSLAAKYPEIAKLVSTNSALKPEDVSTNAGRMLLWVCPDCGNEYTRTADSQVKRMFRVCHSCSYKYHPTDYSDIFQWLSTKNRPNEITYKKTSDILFWVCPRCGQEYERSIGKQRVSKTKLCGVCAGQTKTIYKELGKTQCDWEPFEQKYPELILFLADEKIKDSYVPQREVVDWICPECGSIYERSLLNQLKSEKHICKKCSSKQHIIAKRVRCVETGEVFVSSVEAAKNIGKSKALIVGAIKGRIETAGGYHWEYAEEENNDKGEG